MKPTRRSFLKLALAGGVALLTTSHGTIARAAAVAARRKPSAAPGAGARTGGDAMPPDLRKELDSQIESLAKSLATIRTFPLTPGSTPAFVFRPLRARRTGAR